MEIEISYTEFTWWMLRWLDDSKACELKIDHEDLPTGAEIYVQCGKGVYAEWLESIPCYKSTGKSAQECSGLYLHSISSEEQTKKIMVDLPVPTVRLDLKDCISVPGSHLCADVPVLLFTAEEPLPNEDILRVQGTINEIPFMCSGETCEVPLRPTGEGGVSLEFWADSTFRDSSTHYQGRIRVAEQVDQDQETTSWQVDIVSNEFDLNNTEGCARIWQAFPPLGKPPDWLSNPQHVILLETNEPYTYLGGQLIQQGYVDTSHCDDFGLMEDGYASPCGMEASRELVYLWQNTFDPFIVRTSAETGIPSSLLKRIFATESQFWPETAEHLYLEYGFGHINELGADTALLWNKDFYDQFCPLILEAEKCLVGYPLLDDWSQVLLRGALLSDMEITLPYNYYEIDLEQVKESVSLFAETLLGNCTQVGQMISNELDEVPGEVVSYEDLWRITLANYHGGPGCVSDALIEANNLEGSLDWERISTYIEPNCPWVLDYVDEIVN